MNSYMEMLFLIYVPGGGGGGTERGGDLCVVWCVVQCVIFAERIIPLKYKFSKATEQIYKQRLMYQLITFSSPPN